MKNHQIFSAINGAIRDDGTHFNTLEQLQSDFPASDGWIAESNPDIKALKDAIRDKYPYKS